MCCGNSHGRGRKLASAIQRRAGSQAQPMLNFLPATIVDSKLDLRPSELSEVVDSIIFRPVLFS